jgi:hypothetical protein
LAQEQSDAVAPLPFSAGNQREARRRARRIRDAKQKILVSQSFLSLFSSGQQGVWVALKKFRQISSGPASITKILQSLPYTESHTVLFLSWNFNLIGFADVRLETI